MDEVFLGSVLGATLRVATPLLFSALAGLLSERSGVIDIGLEGKMLSAAFVTASVGVVTGSFVLALSAGILVAVLLSMLHGFACVSHAGDQVISGIAINILAAGLCGVLGSAWFRMGGQTPAIPDAIRLDALWPSMQYAVSGIPWIGEVIGNGLLSHNILVYLALALVPMVWWLLWCTRFGLRLRAVGENPSMVEAAGVSVHRMRYLALMMNGVLSGLAGAYLVLAQSPVFVNNMTAGRGYMALAAMIFGKWHPVGALWACLLFGFLDAIAIRMQGVDFPMVGEIPVQFVQALPYVMTVVLLGGFFGKAIAPKAIGVPYTKERT